MVRKINHWQNGNVVGRQFEYDSHPAPAGFDLFLIKYGHNYNIHKHHCSVIFSLCDKLIVAYIFKLVYGENLFTTNIICVETGAFILRMI